MSFEEMGLSNELLSGLQDLKFTDPTPIQAQAIPQLLPGNKDFMGLAQTGTGKTGAFGLPMLQSLDPKLRQVQGLVICPTRELCLQITGDIKNFARHINGVRVTAVYGGASIYDQIKGIKNGSQIIVATPGRLLDLIRRRAVDLSSVLSAVLDEADEMLNMGFQEDIDAILDKLPEPVRIWLFSATMPRAVRSIAGKYLDDPVEITIGTRNDGAENIEHSFCMVQERHRYEALKRILDYTPEIFGLVFCRTRIDTQRVAESLLKDGYQAEALHGDLSQAQRDTVMRKFRNRSIRILVATDVAARGLDVDDITHIIHFMLPDDGLSYTHRSGRTARAGKSGRSIALINTREMMRIRELERRCHIKFKTEKVPDGKAICRKQLLAFVETLTHTPVKHQDIGEYLPKVYDALESMDKEELIDRLISREFSSLLKDYSHARDINADIRDYKPSYQQNSRYESRGRFRAGSKGNGNGGGKRSGPDRLGATQRFFISIGRIDKVIEGAIVRLVCDKSGIPSKLIGAIDMKREFSFFEVQKSVSGKVRTSCKRATFDGRPVKVVDAFDPGGSGGQKKTYKRKY